MKSTWSVWPVGLRTSVISCAHEKLRSCHDSGGMIIWQTMGKNRVGMSTTNSCIWTSITTDVPVRVSRSSVSIIIIITLQVKPIIACYWGSKSTIVAAIIAALLGYLPIYVYFSPARTTKAIPIIPASCACCVESWPVGLTAATAAVHDHSVVGSS